MIFDKVTPNFQSAANNFNKVQHSLNYSSLWTMSIHTVNSPLNNGFTHEYMDYRPSEFMHFGFRWMSRYIFFLDTCEQFAVHIKANHSLDIRNSYSMNLFLMLLKSVKWLVHIVRCVLVSFWFTFHSEISIECCAEFATCIWILSWLWQ